MARNTRELLAEVDRDIAQGEIAIARQRIVISRLREAGASTAHAEALLLALEANVASFRDARASLTDLAKDIP